MKEYVGSVHAKEMTIAIVVARFNDLITRSLLEGALQSLKRHGINEKQVVVAWVPGSLELPLVAKVMAESKKYDAIICLGAIIRGATSHYDVVVNQTASGISRIALDNNIPVVNGVLTVESIEQALERSGTKMGNKGADVAVAAIEMVNLLRQIAS